MKPLKLLTILLCLSLGLESSLFAQEAAFRVSSPNEKLYAMDATRFHLGSLKQFYTVLYSFDQYKGFFTELDARILNMGLNAFLTSQDREELLLKALRTNQSVRLRFKVPERKARLDPTVKDVPVTIEIQPLLDGPSAFRITMEKETAKVAYDLDWAGHVVGFSRG